MSGGSNFASLESGRGVRELAPAQDRSRAAGRAPVRNGGPMDSRSNRDSAPTARREMAVCADPDLRIEKVEDQATVRVGHRMMGHVRMDRRDRGSNRRRQRKTSSRCS